ncbi:MAG: FMN-binding protein [Candidatus Firestonebacteria bacterium]|nr:FMN-binding protein [Candidatus Firestonebacteria bacterium]
MKKFVSFFKYLILVTILFSPLIYNLSQRYFQQEKINEKDFLKEVFPQASSFSIKFKNPPHYIVYKNINNKNEILGAIFITSDLFPDEKGYAGPIKILVGMEKNGTITGIRIIHHSETPSYANGITQKWFYNQYSGLSLNNNFEIGKDIDGISRATISVTAINRAVRKSARFIGKNVFNLPVPKEDEFVWQDMFINQDLPLLLGLFLIAIIAYKIKNKTLRNVSLILGIFYLGFFKENFFSIINILNILFLKFPDISNYLIWYLLIIAILLTTILWGRIYCYYICPFGGVQEFIYSINRLGSVPPRNIGEKIGNIKFIILWIIVLVSSITGNIFLTVYEPFSTLFGRMGTILSWILVFFVLLASFIYNRFWCKYFCAAGAVLDFLSKLFLSCRKIFLKKQDRK